MKRAPDHGQFLSILWETVYMKDEKFRRENPLELNPLSSLFPPARGILGVEIGA